MEKEDQIKFLQAFIEVWNYCADAVADDSQNDNLVAIYQVFISASGLPNMSADELLIELQRESNQIPTSEA